jgi:hypothetical protein
MIRPMPTIGEFFRMIDEGDGVLTFFLTLAMFYLGNIASRVRHVSYRCGAYVAAFIAALYFIYAFITYGRMQPDSLIGIVWRSLMAAGIAYGFAALAICLTVSIVAPPIRTVRRWLDRRRSRINDQLSKRAREESERLQLTAQLERERRLAPLRERERRDAEMRAARRQTLDQLRDRLRYDLGLEFKRIRTLAPEILTESDLTAQLDHALAPDDESEINRRVALLRDAFTVIQAKAPKTYTFESMAQDFIDRHAAIDRSVFPDQIKDKLHRWVNLQGEHDIARLRRVQT